ncbi:hypothetical protein L9F63_015447 [Diploptera punctata]|uniref:CHK kinase-like domain-containing protein n=1 Tax=Diploptera punctata TaxID=6984 RepID=A0AAD8A5I6_DIPPU|nr:hypothetical protein L9F63_015447 [Diploptera punctata]
MDSTNDDKVNIELKKEDLEKLLQSELHSDLKVKYFISKPLTNPGDNYGSTILDVEVFYHKGESNDLYKLPIVAKLVPESPFLRKVFNIEITFNKEVRAYTLVAPEFRKIQEEKGIPEQQILDVFPKYYGSRSNRQDDINMEADDSAVLLIENLKLSGYELRDRRKGFNFGHMKLTVSKLAQFHALGIAIKLLKPEVFNDSIMKTCQKFDVANPDDDDANENWITSIIDHVKHIPEIIPYLDKIEKRLRTNTQMRKDRREYPIREPFATIVHNDFWVNNVMFKYDESTDDTDKNKSSPTGIKFVDFQGTIYASPVRDLIFLLFSSSEDGLLEKHYDNFIRRYHEEFIGLLTKLGCDTRLFTYEHFLEEINVCAVQEFSHILFMLNPISVNPSDTVKLANITSGNILQKKIGEIYDRKAKTLVQKFVGNGWL